MDEKKILIKTSNEIKLFVTEDILFCKAWDCWSIIYLKNGVEEKVPFTLKKVEEKLSKFNFRRVHRSYLINIEHIVQIHGNYESIQLNDWLIPIAKRNRTYLKKYLLDHFN